MATRIDEKSAKELFISNDLKPLVPWINTTTPWQSKCLRCGKKVSPTYNKVRLRGHQCKYCSSHNVDENEAKTQMKSSGFLPLVAYPGSNTPWRMRCKKCKKEVSPTYSNVKKGIGCKFCSKRAVDPIDSWHNWKSNNRIRWCAVFPMNFSKNFRQNFLARKRMPNSKVSI